MPHRKSGGCHTYLMEQAKTSLRKRLRRIGIFELVVFLLSCGVHYFIYKIRGKLPFTSELDVLFFLSWPAMGIVMTYAARALNTNPAVTPRQILAATVIYGVLYAKYAIGMILPVLIAVFFLNRKMPPFWVMATGPLPWLLLRGWFSWLLIRGALKLVKATKAAAEAALEPTPSAS